MHSSMTHDVPYHRQQNWFYCGAASVQMVLEALGMAGLRQDDLYRQARENSLERGLWRSSPDGMAWALNANRSRHVQQRFAVIASDDAEAQARWLVWYLHRAGIPPIVLVQRRMHWLVVCSCSTSGAPVAPRDTSYRIEGFVVNDPWPPAHVTRTTLEARHGIGIGHANQYVPYATWLDTYAMRVDVGRWKGKYVALCDIDACTDRDAEPNASRISPPTRAAE